MTAIKRTIGVSFEHQVHFTDGVFDLSNPLLKDILTGPAPRAAALVVVDEGLALAQPGLTNRIADYFAASDGRLHLVGPPLLIEGGERAKNSCFHVSQIHSQVERCHLDRHSCLLGVGGGALLDVAGLAAATAHRGLRHVRIPTTTLSQCDAGVGIKNGINAFGKKNFIGTFAPPFAVINDFQMLSSLSDRDKRAGGAEAVKVALIRDRDFFEQLEREAAQLAAFAPAALREMIRRCAELHVDHIASGGDAFETGAARPLDFGHWAAHKLEQLSGYGIRHGEAVAAGMALDVVYARQAGLLGAAAAERALALLEALGFALFASEMLYLDSDHQRVLLQGLEEFREHLGGELSLTMLQDIGRPVEIHQVSLPGMLDAIHHLQQRQARQARKILCARRQ
ncbi:MAG: 3-dehydroquinate synthase [Verrucomicrobiota bacterium]